MHVSIRLFAGLAEVIGSSTLTFHAPESPLTAGRLKEQLAASYPAAAPQISVSLVAVDREYAPDDTVITENSEVALIPPVSGGEALPVTEEPADPLFSITDQPLQEIGKERISRLMNSQAIIHTPKPLNIPDFVAMLKKIAIVRWHIH